MNWRWKLEQKSRNHNNNNIQYRKAVIRARVRERNNKPTKLKSYSVENQKNAKRVGTTQKVNEIKCKLARQRLSFSSLVLTWCKITSACSFFILFSVLHCAQVVRENMGNDSKSKYCRSHLGVNQNCTEKKEGTAKTGSNIDWSNWLLHLQNHTHTHTIYAKIKIKSARYFACYLAWKSIHFVTDYIDLNWLVAIKEHKK